MANKKINPEMYQNQFSDEKLVDKLKKFAKKAGVKTVYYVLILWNILKSSTSSLTNKALITGALGYFIMPFDVIPDFMLGMGYTDDIGVLTMVLLSLASSVDSSILDAAKKDLKDWGFDVSDADLDDFDDIFD